MQVLYKDIMTPLKPIGVDVDIKSGIGPVISNPIKSVSDVDKLTQIDPKRDVPYVLETPIANTREIECTINWVYRCAIYISFLYD